MRLEEFGWDPFFERAFRENASPEFLPARVIEEQKGGWWVIAESGEYLAEVPGKMRKEHPENLPAVGDWTAVEVLNKDRAVIRAVLPRKSKLSRKAAGDDPVEQVMAANIDTVFMMSSLNHDLNQRRIERYLVTIKEGGAQPVILLNKTDLCPDLNAALQEIESVRAGAPVHAVCALTGQGLEALDPYLLPGKTIVITGSSGVGKSTLINFLAGKTLQDVRGIRESDARGRHTTTYRSMFVLPEGALIIDTPGIRELQLWSAGGGLREAFPELMGLEGGCKFRDCRHEAEPGCAIKSAVENGMVPQERYESYLKLKKEILHLARRQDELAREEHKNKSKRTTRALNRRLNEKRDL